MIKINSIPAGFAVALGLLFAAATGLESSAQKITRDQLNFFESKIRPVLVRECYSCHSEQAGQTKGGLQLDTKVRMEIGGNTGPAIVPGDLEESLLWSAINYEDYAMPPQKQLSARVIADFRDWIDMGAPDPRKSKVETIRSSVTDEDIKKGRKFWAYKKPKRPEVPKVAIEDWPVNEIDRFIYSKLADEGLSPPEDADPNSLLRRLSFDLIGLPPDPQQIAWFEKKWADDPDAAIAHVVDRMLDNPRFGERWGRHWLDVARYAESTGRELNATFPNAWRYRDYVIDAFNNDKPYNEFVQEQIAGDLLPARTDEIWAEHLIATGFLAVGPKTLTEQNARQFQLDLVDEQIDVSTRVVLGTSVACARCHDHKFDPIPQKDYYAMAGIFESTSTHYGTIDSPRNRRPGNQLILPVSDPNPFDETLSSETVNRLQEELAEKRQVLDELARARREARRSGKRDENLRRDLANLTRTTAQIATIESKLNSVDESGQPVSFCMGVQDKDQPTDARLLVRGEFDQPTDYVKRGFVQVLSTRGAKIEPNSSGRLELAKWMTSKKNPLTARVMVNRIWQHMFGAGIVRTPENFGATGQLPTHPELLDYLAVEFMQNDWSIKEMIRLMANSRSYRMSAEFDSESFQVDPDNLFRWRANPRQLEAELLRDAMLAVSGALETARPRASMVAEAGLTVVRDGLLASFQVNDDFVSMSMSEARPQRRSRSTRRRVKIYDLDELQDCRSVYLPIVRDQLPRALEVFDFAEPGMVVGVRESSNTPAQGLFLLNNQFVLDQSELMADRLMREASSVTDQIKLAFRLAYAREATTDELQAAEQFLEDFPARQSYRNGGRSKQQNKLAALAHAILASAEFRYTN